MNKKTKHSVLSNLWFWSGYFLKYEPRILWISIIDILLSPLFRILTLYFPKVTLALVENQAPAEMLLLVLSIYTLVYLAARSISFGLVCANEVTVNSERQKVVFRLFLKSLRINYAYTETEEGRDTFRKAVGIQDRGDGSASSQFVFITRSLITTILTFVLYSVVLGSLSIWMVFILLILAMLGYLLDLRENRFRNSIRQEQAVNDKHYYYMKGAMGQVSAAKDIRIFGMGAWLRERMDLVMASMEKLEQRKAAWVWRNGFLSGILNLIRDLGAYAFLIYRAVENHMTASDFVLYFGAITGFSGFVRDVAYNLANLQKVSDDTDWVRGYMELPEEDVSSGSRHVSELTQPVSIEFRDVSFSYQSGGRESRIFSHLNLHINEGEKLALVGVNGAGKSTLIKLLCGFYEPDEGQILFNGIDSKEFPRAELYKLFSVVFQETFFPAVKMDESIVLKETEKVDQERLAQALEKAGMAEVFREKGIEMNRYRGSLKKRGVEFSGGQNQRLLLARALYQDGAVLVLDEPTAALDPIAESQVYNAYQEHCQGRTSIFISHRLASTGFSDRIVLLDKGQIVEMGSHRELLERNGRYAELFRVQSSYYRKEEQDGQECSPDYES